MSSCFCGVFSGSRGQRRLTLALPSFHRLCCPLPLLAGGAVEGVDFGACPWGLAPVDFELGGFPLPNGVVKTLGSACPLGDCGRKLLVPGGEGLSLRDGLQRDHLGLPRLRSLSRIIGAPSSPMLRLTRPL